MPAISSVNCVGTHSPPLENLTKSRFLPYSLKPSSSILQAKCKQSPFLTICRISGIASSLYACTTHPRLIHAHARTRVYVHNTIYVYVHVYKICYSAHLMFPRCSIYVPPLLPLIKFIHSLCRFVSFLYVEMCSNVQMF